MKFLRWLHTVVEGGSILIALGLPLVFNPWSPVPFEPVKRAFFQTVTLGMACAAFGAWWMEDRRPLRNPLLLPATLWVGAYGVATLASAAPSFSPGASETMNVFCLAFFLILVSTELRSLSQMNRLVAAMVLGSIPVALYGLFQAIGLDPLPWVTDSVSPVLSTMGRSNFLGAYLAAVLPFTLWQAASSGSIRSALALALQILCLWFTFARAAWAGFVAGSALVLALLAHLRQEQRLKVAAAGVLLIGLGAFTVMNRLPPPHWPAYQARDALWENTLSFTEWRTASVNARRIIWITTINLLERRWLLGYGPRTFATVFAQHYPVALLPVDPKTIDHPHNLFLQVGMDAGLVGLLALLFLFLTFYKAALRSPIKGVRKELQIAAMGSVTASLVVAQFTPDTIVSLAFRMLAIALGAAATREPDAP